MIESERIVKRKDYENGRVTQTYICDLIRCKDCKHFAQELGLCYKHGHHGENWFCADGKRKD